MTAHVLSQVWLVVDKDRDVIAVFADEAGARESAAMQDCIAESWPIQSGPRNKAWVRAVQATRNRPR